MGAHFEATKALLLLGAPVTTNDLKQRSNATCDTRQLRADLQAWAADTLAQHRTFHGTFLCGCFARTTSTSTTNPYLPLLVGKPGLLEDIAAFVGYPCWGSLLPLQEELLCPELSGVQTPTSLPTSVLVPQSVAVATGLA